MVQNPRKRNGWIPFFLILYYTYLNHKINTIFLIFKFLLKFYQKVKQGPISFGVLHKTVYFASFAPAFLA